MILPPFSSKMVYPLVVNGTETLWAVGLGTRISFLATCVSSLSLLEFTFGVISRTMPIWTRVASMEELKARIREAVEHVTREILDQM
jgi:hypothetical protein